ncbi:MAG: type II toxin-antitoxin system RelE/ParE family toxin [Desulfomonile tiedjei]|nr:type II toxin-antitoxin system RelE/ParE family toxin [Desulfomonile tiedjei]
MEHTKVFIEVPVFTEDARKNLREDELRAIQYVLTVNPKAGTLIPGCKGLWKLRWGAKGRGKTGGIRIIYYWAAKHDQILFLYLFPKNETEDLTTKQYKILREYVRREYNE